MNEVHNIGMFRTTWQDLQNESCCNILYEEIKENGKYASGWKTAKEKGQ